MTDAELQEIKKDAIARVRVGCDEMHRHTAVGDCLVGESKDVTILKLIETVLHERAVVREAAEKLGGPPWWKG
jgi:hypothetical protein